MADLTSESKARFARIWIAKLNRDTDFLIQALKDPEHRPMAAKYLGKLGCADAAPSIMPLLEAHDAWHRGSAIRALGKLRNRESVERLITLVEDGIETESNRLWAIASLGEIGDPSVFRLLVSGLGSESWNARRATAYALGLLGDVRATEPLRRAARAEPITRRRPYWWALRGIRASHRRQSRDSP